MTIAKPMSRIVDYWHRTIAEVPQGVSAETIAAFESKQRVILPADVREYFMTANGTGDDMDVECLRFWPLDEVKPVHEELAGYGRVSHAERFSYPDCFVFADFLIHSWLLAVRVTSDPEQPAPVFQIMNNSPPGDLVADSFREFLERYAGDPWSIQFL